MRSVYFMEKPMHKTQITVVSILIGAALILAACNLPQRQIPPSPTSIVAVLPQSSPTPTPLCANPYFPNAAGDQWEYTGTNSLIGAYTRTDTTISSNEASFTQQSNLDAVTYSVPYDCSSTGLTSQNPVQQYAGALLNSPDAPVDVKLSSNSGTTLPVNIAPGDTWQQSADFEATSTQVNVNGRFVFEYTAAGVESVTVPAGTFNAMRVDGTIRIQVTSLHVPAGTYSIMTWWAPGVGIVKSEGVSHVPGVDFTDSLQLASYAFSR